MLTLGFFNALSTIISNIKTERELARLTPKQLTDIGITHGAIYDRAILKYNI